ncbi:MAG: glutamate-5-semialdehyde dehydrogenase [Opitutales bacterium]|nr:glutamate-5-semialdehyde dehydrogenase [Opitutales bacterium]MBQ2722625.1 glutamate-5-semialdehyde dehydrogenase [Opitutales bacterium]
MKTVLEIAQQARKASHKIASYSAEIKNQALQKLADLIELRAEEIKSANAIDVQNAQGKLSKPMLERLTLNDKKIASMAEGVRQVAELGDPVGEIIETSTRPNGMRIDKVRVPIGVIGIIYESRPNVTIDCAVLCLKSGNASILRGGSECFETNKVLASLVSDALAQCGLDADCVQMIPTTDRSAFGELLKLDKYVDCIIPRGGEKLIRFVVENSSIPVIKHYKGVCTVYVDKSADADVAQKLLVNAKCQRPSVCNAAENLIVHSNVAESMLPKLCSALIENGVEIRASEKAGQVLSRTGIAFNPATDEDFSTEYTDLIISVDVVDSVEDAVEFINKNGSGHSDLIITTDNSSAEIFMNGADSSTVYWNVSTRFTDGFEFGFGAEIGISTDKLHARGPMGLKELCSYKYKVYGNGQIRG